MINVFRLIQVSVFAVLTILHISMLVYSLERSLWFNGVIYKPEVFLEYLKYGIAVYIVLVLFVLSPLSDLILLLFYSARRISGREDKKVRKAVTYVESEYVRKYGKEIKLRVLALDLPHVEAYALSRRTILISTGLLRTCSDEELTAVIAHETGHLHHKDTTILFLQNLSRIICTLLFTLLRLFRGGNCQRSGDTISFSIAFFVVIFYLLHVPHVFMLALLFLFASKIMAQIDTCLDCPIEYRADGFAASMGLGAGLISYLERIEGEDVRSQTGFLSYLSYSHPPVALRIDEIERDMSKIEERSSVSS